VKSYCKRDFEPATYTEYLQGNGRKELVLRHRPVTAVTSVHLDWDGNADQNPEGSFEAASLLTAGKDYFLNLDGSWGGDPVSFSGLLVRVRNVWPEVQRQWYWTKLSPETGPAPGSIRVIYTAGYDPAPEDLQYAVVFLVQAMRKDLPVGGNLESEKIGDYSYKLRFPFPGELPELGTVRQILSTYRETSLGTF
jgi:hypothetical protein